MTPSSQSIPILEVQLPTHTPSAPTRRACQAAFLLGLNLDPPRSHSLAPIPCARHSRNAPCPRSASRFTPASTASLSSSSSLCLCGELSDSTLSLPLPPNSIALITGPSGSGKSSLLRALVATARTDHDFTIINPARIRLRPAPTVDLFRGPVTRAMAALARAGLAEASCFIRRPSELSEGQRFRLQLALALHKATRITRRTPRPSSSSPPHCPLPIPYCLLSCDEFAATLDRLTAQSVAHLLARTIHDSPHPLRAIIATSHDDLTDALSPDTHIHCSLTTPPRITHRAHTSSARPLKSEIPSSPSGSTPASTASPSSSSSSSSAPSLRFEILKSEIPSSSGSTPASTASTATPSSFPSSSSPRLCGELFSISPGSLSDYHTLSPLHYRAADPATIALILTARLPTIPDPLAVLVVSFPVLNAPWRALAWPGRYDSPDKRANATRLTREVRAISRVIVDPRVRSRGIASSLVRAYLANPLTPHTEALAAMGACSNFFTRAGMTPHPLPPNHADTRLLDLLSHLHIEPWRLAAPTHVLHRIRNPSAPPHRANPSRASAAASSSASASTTASAPSPPDPKSQILKSEISSFSSSVSRCLCGELSPPPKNSDSALLERELRRWANFGRARLCARNLSLDALFRFACARITPLRTAWTHTAPITTPTNRN